MPCNPKGTAERTSGKNHGVMRSAHNSTCLLRYYRLHSKPILGYFEYSEGFNHCVDNLH